MPAFAKVFSLYLWNCFLWLHRRGGTKIDPSAGLGGRGGIISSFPAPPRSLAALPRLSQLQSRDNAVCPCRKALAGLEMSRARWKDVPKGDRGACRDRWCIDWGGDVSWRGKRRNSGAHRWQKRSDRCRSRHSESPREVLKKFIYK